MLMRTTSTWSLTSVCKPCPANAFTTNNQSTSIVECSCKKGFYFDWLQVDAGIAACSECQQFAATEIEGSVGAEWQGVTRMMAKNCGIFCYHSGPFLVPDGPPLALPGGFPSLSRPWPPSQCAFQIVREIPAGSFFI